jgi:hypothetical protein
MDEPTAQPEQVLLGDPTTADLGAKVTQAWRGSRALTAVLPTLARAQPASRSTRPSGTGDAVYATTVLAGPAGALRVRGQCGTAAGYR